MSITAEESDPRRADVSTEEEEVSHNMQNVEVDEFVKQTRTGGVLGAVPSAAV